MGNRLGGRVAVITGASKGLGAAIARRFASEGASVVVNYSTSVQAADRVVAEIGRAGGSAIAVQADMRDPEEVTALFATTVETFGRLDVLVNNAGVYDFQPLENVSLALFRKHFELNVFGYLLGIKEAASHMRAGEISLT